jgi:hypothetical protein
MTDEVPGAEAEAAEEQILDQATAAQTLAELEAEIAILKDLEDRALRLKLSGQDAKWRQLALWRSAREEGGAIPQGGRRRRRTQIVRGARSLISWRELPKQCFDLPPRHKAWHHSNPEPAESRLGQ